VCLLSRQRRLLDLHQRLVQALFDETTPATDIATLLEEEALRVQAAPTQAGCSGPAPCCPRSWRTQKRAACSGR